MKAAPKSASVELKGISKSFDGTSVVESLDLSIADGEFLVLVGPSGCGKSTTLRMIAGLESVDQGDLFMGDERVNDVSPKDRDIGMVFQSYALYPHMTVAENMAFGLKLRKTPKEEIRRRVEKVAASLGLQQLLERKPSQLSGGQRQRVAMGRAIVREPRVFLFDEPLSNLDAALRVEMRAELSALHRRLGTTMIYVTHDQTEAMTLGTRIAVLHGGKLQQVDSPLDLFDRPVNQFVAGFIGSPKMNFIDGTLSSEHSHFETALGPIENPWQGLSVEPGKRLTLGVRPAHISLERSSGPRGAATVTMIEPMGWETRIHLETQGAQLIVQHLGQGFEGLDAGQSLNCIVNPGELYAFDSSGKTVAFPTRVALR
ncbi:MAG: sn-glycerol-3-phosphate ABC transporter ATP-binding protein UgpC [Deltaproteobacteria bacterium]|nr:sn-glycerol-3-phosphate ABC transporter ATP-binding protein UgpC [Deltaproteobacteria bacterium]